MPSVAGGLPPRSGLNPPKRILSALASYRIFAQAQSLAQRRSEDGEELYR